MLRMLQDFANEVGERIAAEYNASCPNIPGTDYASLLCLLDVLR